MNRPYLKIVIKSGAPKELIDMIFKHFTPDGPIVEIQKLTKNEYLQSLEQEKMEEWVMKTPAYIL